MCIININAIAKEDANARAKVNCVFIIRVLNVWRRARILAARVVGSFDAPKSPAIS